MSDMPIKEDTQPYIPSNPAYMRQPEPRKRGCGCWVTGIVTLLVAAVLVGVGLFLPPVNLYDRLFGVQYAMLDSETNAVAAEGLTLIVNPADAGQNFGVALEPVTLAQMRAASPAANVQAANVAVAVPGAAKPGLQDSDDRQPPRRNHRRRQRAGQRGQPGPARPVRME